MPVSFIESQMGLFGKIVERRCGVSTCSRNYFSSYFASRSETVTIGRRFYAGSVSQRRRNVGGGASRQHDILFILPPRCVVEAIRRCFNARRAESFKFRYATYGAFCDMRTGGESPASPQQSPRDEDLLERIVCPIVSVTLRSSNR